jgi:hypothetical protein
MQQKILGWRSVWGLFRSVRVWMWLPVCVCVQHSASSDLINPILSALLTQDPPSRNKPGPRAIHWDRGTSVSVCVYMVIITLKVEPVFSQVLRPWLGHWGYDIHSVCVCVCVFTCTIFNSHVLPVNTIIKSGCSSWFGCISHTYGCVVVFIKSCYTSIVMYFA